MPRLHPSKPPTTLKAELAGFLRLNLFYDRFFQIADNHDFGFLILSLAELGDATNL
ncbi:MULTISPECIES: hypothetical protein [unclassified Microcoleus]|uniref:hypothetical protein n=1 Tax=unclassified Microcoleus TaxID=2642155 RepID=UPI002FD67062